MSSALWMGFEYDFENCIHLLAPQVEHLIRTISVHDKNAQSLKGRGLGDK